MTIGTQQIASFTRQLGAWAAIGYSIVSSLTGTSWGAKDTVLTTAGAILLAIEHYVSDPSTGTPTSGSGTV